MIPDAGMVSDERFRKKEHLLKSREFNKVYKRGSPARANGVVLYCLANGLDYNRLGFSIGSKNIKRSTSRNRIRRIFREVYRKTKRDLRRGFDMVMVVRKDLSAELTYSLAEALFLKLAKDTKIII